MPRNLKVVVTDEDGTVLDAWDVEVPETDGGGVPLTDYAAARRAVVEIGENVAGGIE